MAVSAVDFPKEHWDPVRIQDGFRKLGIVVDIDPAFLGDDHSILRVVVARRSMARIDNDQYMGNPGKGARGQSLGTAFTIEVLRIWPREEQLGELGNLRPFFPRPPGGANGGGNHPLDFHGPLPPFRPVLQGSVVGPAGWAFDGPIPVAYYYGFVSPFPLPPLPPIPLMVHLPLLLTLPRRLP